MLVATPAAFALFDQSTRLPEFVCIVTPVSTVTLETALRVTFFVAPVDVKLPPMESASVSAVSAMFPAAEIGPVVVMEFESVAVMLPVAVIAPLMFEVV